MATRINPEYCKGCQLCVLICPKEVYQEGQEPSPQGYFVPRITCPEKCLDADRKPGEKLRCQLCVLECPDQAITWEKTKQPPDQASQDRK
jgi:2-oxoglutarate ferredoxin oxidoreductase subunit delta